MKVQNNPKRDGCFIYVVAIVCSLILIVVIRYMIFGEASNLPNIRVTKFQIIIPIFLIVLIINIVVAMLGFVVARYNQWKPILWLNERLFSTVEKKRNSKPKSNSLFKKFNDKFNPERLLEFKEQDIPYGCYVSEPEEKFMSPEHPFFYKSWMASTIYSTLLWSIRNVLLITVISSILAMINTNFLILGFLFSLGLFFSMMLFYWRREWERFTEVFFVTTHRFGYVKGQFSWSGLIFGTGVDISFEEYDFRFLGSTYIDPVPDDAGYDKIMEFVLETLAKGKERVGTFKINIIGNNNSSKDLIMNNFSYTPYIKTLIDTATDRNEEIKNYDADLDSISRHHIIGKPGQYADIDAKQEQIQEWKNYHKKGSPELVDVFLLVREHIEKMSTAETNDKVETINIPHPIESNDGKNDTNGPVDSNIFPG